RLRPHASAAAAGNPRARELRATGISHFGPLLSDAQAGELQRYFLGKPVHDPYRDASRRFLPDSAERHPDSHIAHHDALDIIRAPHLFGLANRPDILAVAADFLGCKPTLGYLASWWSYPTRLGAQQAEHFHRDVDDWRFVKLFVYLTDVAADNGPHIYVSRSASSPALRRIRRYDDAEVVQAFGRDNVLELTARAGEGFMEDTFGMHKGQPVASGRRLIFQAVYSMFALPYGPKSAVARIDEVRLPDGSRPDPWINRLYLSR
ncbi:MAG: hypothetical protein KGL43_13335, partial [Burkholderiales bacterium]|nr:hypothetical protein [Burkholderiales bacterium]